MLITWLDPSAGVNKIHPLMLYSDPTYILLLTLIWGPSQLPMRPAVSKLCVSPLGSATGGVALVRVELPERELHPSRPPSEKFVVMPELSCWLGLRGGGANSPIVTSSM